MTLPRTRLLLGRGLICLALAAVLAPATPIHAQTTIADPDAYREAKRAATAKFLDRTAPTAERLAAAPKLGYPDEPTFARLLDLGTDRTQDDMIRWEALRRHRYDDRYVDAVLKILDDPQDGGEELDARLIDDLNRRTITLPPAQVRQEIQRVFRKLLGDPRDKVRLFAYRAAVSNHDQVAVTQLADSLRRGRDFPVPLPEVIKLLDQDGAVNHVAALRPYLQHADRAVQAQAARALAVDPQSRPAIVALVRNPATPVAVRLNAVRALAREDAQFASYAIAMVEDASVDPAIRHAAMHGVAGRMNYAKLPPAEQVRFAEAVEKLAAAPSIKTGESVKIQESARQLHFHLRQSFPEIQKHYETK